jgi:hypothetical protein
MTVVRLEAGGLWVHAPVAPTGECVRLLNELGQVEHIVLSTTAFEHKVYVADFSRRYPKAKVWACPGQWSYPINLPPPFRVDATLGDGDPKAPWAAEIQQAVFTPPVIGIGPANEVVFFHKKVRAEHEALTEHLWCPLTVCALPPPLPPVQDPHRHRLGAVRHPHSS